MRVLKFVLVFLVAFFFGFYYDVVYGASCGNDRSTHNLVYDISSLELGNNRIRFKGYAFIDHYDNYGGYNTTISIIASKESSVSNISRSSYKELETSSYDENVDLYGARCTGGGCSNRIKIGIENKIKATGFGFAKCNEDRDGQITNISGYDYELSRSGTYNWEGGTCVIRGVGFDISFDYDDLINELHVQPDDQIYFYIKVWGKFTQDCSEEEILPIGVNDEVCWINGVNCVNDYDYTLGQFKFRIQELSNRGTIVSYRSIPLDVDTFKSVHSMYHYFEKDKSFLIKGYVPNRSYIVNKYGDNDNDSNHMVRVNGASYYLLATYGFCYSHSHADGVNCSGDESPLYDDYYDSDHPNGARLYKHSGDEQEKLYYASSSWLRVNGSVVLTGLGLSEPPIKTDCSKISSWESTDNDTSKRVDCGGSTPYSACINISEEDPEAVMGTIYVKSQTGSISSSQCSSAGGVFYSSSCYLKATVKASVSIYQKGDYSLGKVASVSRISGTEVRENGEVKAGQPFNFFVSGQSYASSYNNSISWINNKKWDDSTYYYLYQDFHDQNCNAGGCSSVDTSVSDNYDALYYASGSSSPTCRGTANEVSKCAIEDAMKSKINSNSSKLNSMYTSSEYDNSTGKEFPADWSGSSVEGAPSSVTDSEGNTFDVKVIDSSYTFNLRDGYLNLNDINDIQYPTSGTLGDPYVKFGKRIYVPLKYKPGSNYTINLEKSKDSDYGISFVNGIKWGITGTCSMFVRPGLYDDPDNPNPDPSTPSDPGDPWNPSFAIRYRSIDVNNPFPKATTDDDLPANWKVYKEEVGNFDRINDSYGNYPDNPDYRYNGPLNLSDSVPYTSWSNICPNDTETCDFYSSGSSIFIYTNSEFSVLASSGNNYCPLGEFNATCNNVVNRGDRL